MKTTVATIGLVVTVCATWAQQKSTIDYLKMKPVGETPEVFAPGLISTDSIEHSAPAFAPDGNTVMWTSILRGKPSFLMEMRKTNGQWSSPTPVAFDDPTTDDFYPSFSSDGKKLYFSSRRPLPWKTKGPRDIGIWVAERTSDGWVTPVPFDTTVSTGREYAHSTANNGSIYFSYRRPVSGDFDLFQSKREANGTYSTPQPLPYLINMKSYDDGPFVSPADDYLIFESDRAGGFGSNDLYICFKNKAGDWVQPINMGPRVNTAVSERFAKVSPDGRFLFFGRGFGTKSDIYWVDASFINELRKTNTAVLDPELGKETFNALREGNRQKSIELLRQTLNANPTITGVAFDLVSLLMESSNFEEAEKTIQRIPLEIADPAVLTKRALIAYALGKTADGEKWANLVELNSINKFFAQVSLANTLLGMKLYPAAITHYNKAIVIQPRGGEYYNLACAHALNKNTNDAFASLDKAIDLGYNARQQFESDTDLESLKSDNRWQPLIEKLTAIVYQLDAAAPHTRAHHAIVYDEASEKMVMTTGSTPLQGGQAFQFFNDLWMYHNNEWKSAGHIGDERSGIRLAYHVREKKIYSYGGFLPGNQSSGDLRVLEGNNWKTLTNLPEMMAAEPGFAYDIQRNVLVAFGGSAGRNKVNNITWEWNGTLWKKIDGPGPEGRQAFAMIYDSKRQKVVLFGGGGEQHFLADTWEFDGNAWTKVSDTGPSPRVSPGYAYDSKRGLMILFGGMADGKMQNDTWAWNGHEWKKLADTGPAPRAMGYMAYDSKRDRVVLFGGRLGWPNDANDTWEWDGMKWMEVNNTIR